MLKVVGEWINEKYIKHIDYECDICGYKGSMRKHHFDNGVGCAACSGKAVVPGFNDIATTSPDIAKYIYPKSDAQKYTKTSHKKVVFKCDICGFERSHTISSMTRRGHFTCPVCSPGISYPNRVFAAFLSELGIKFETEKRFPWSKNKRYDFFLTDYEVIIEVNGQQHYINKTTFNDSLEDIKANDEEKFLMAASHNEVYAYAVIPLLNTEPITIKNQILSNGIFEHLCIDTSVCDWDKVFKYADRKLPKECLDMWNSGVKSVREIAKSLGLSTSTVCSYLKRYSSIGLCGDYDPYEQRVKNHILANEARKRPVICVTNGMVFSSINEAAKYAGVIGNSIQNCLAGRTKTSGKDENGTKLSWAYLPQGKEKE